jgi:hypothetical protein
MAETPPPTPVETVSAAKRLHTAFQSVFGQPSLRSSNQRLVLEHLRKVTCMDMPIFTNTGPDRSGSFDPLAAAHRDGARTMYLIIERQLELARLSAEDKPKPKAKR